MSSHEETLVRSMVDRFPSLSALLEEHLQDNFGELLPHLFLGDVTRYVVSLHSAASRGAVQQQRELADILDDLENEYGNPESQELISVSFLENLPRPGELGSAIRRLVGPHLGRQLDVIG